MAAIMEKHQRCSEEKRKAKHSSSKNRPKKSLRMCLTVDIRCCMIIFLAFVLPCAASIRVEGQKGDNITLPLENREDVPIYLTFGSKIVYGSNQDQYYKGRVHESGNGDLILRDLKTTDAGKYRSNVYENSVPISSKSYDVHVKVNLTGQKGEELMFDDLPREAESVKHSTSTGCSEVWRRGRGVLTDRLTEKNDRLTIINFSSRDAGTYRVLNSSGEILVTMMVKELGPMERAGPKVPSGSSMIRFSWGAALPLICVFIVRWAATGN